MVNKKIIVASMLVCLVGMVGSIFYLLRGARCEAIAAGSEKKVTIAIAVVSTPGRESFFQFNYQALRGYAEKWNYDVYISKETVDASRHPNWSKIKMLQTLLDEGKYDWYVWLDDDLIITNPQISIESLIQKYGKEPVHFIIGAHKTVPVDMYDVNTGVFIVRQSEWSKEFLRQIWAMGTAEKYLVWEQSAVQDLMSSAEYARSPHINRVPGRTIQSILTLLNKRDRRDYGQWQPGDFIAHMAGGDEYCRTLMSAQLIASPSRYPELPEHLSEFFTIRQDK
jgi:hypothetical protein